ncbi:hypothetical protein Tco_1216784 [Tanacetum coccineum]
MVMPSNTEMWSLDHLSVSVPSRGLYKTKPPSPRVIKSLIQVPRQGQETRTKNKKMIVVGYSNHVCPSISELAFDHFLSLIEQCIARSHFERKTRSDHGKKRPLESMIVLPPSTLILTSNLINWDDSIEGN